VSNVRNAWLDNPTFYEGIFGQIGRIVQDAQRAITGGEFKKLGLLLDKNHKQLQMLGVSSSELDHLVNVAKSAGALGAKLSGGGGGGNMIALVTSESAEQVADALQSEGAVNTIISVISSTI
jgi:mevalonate kinase